MAELTIRRMATRDLRAYKALRDSMLEAHPEAFTSDVADELRRRIAEAANKLDQLGTRRRQRG